MTIIPLAVAIVAFRAANAAFFCGANDDFGRAIRNHAKQNRLVITWIACFATLSATAQV